MNIANSFGEGKANELKKVWYEIIWLVHNPG